MSPKAEAAALWHDMCLSLKESLRNHASIPNYPCQECWHVICIDSGRRKNDIRPSRILSSWHDIASMLGAKAATLARRPPWKELGILIRWLLCGSHIFTNIVIPVSWGLAPLAADHRHILYQKKSLAPACLLATAASWDGSQILVGLAKWERMAWTCTHSLGPISSASQKPSNAGGSLSFPLTSSVPSFFCQS